MPDTPDSMANALRDRYTLQRELGRGGMAVVYLAHDLRHDRPVALKVLHSDLGASLGPERFQREIQLTARLQHPHILAVHDSGETAGRLWYTMPYFPGESLRARLDREGQLPLDDALAVGRNILAALAHAHRQGILHRDIKPENILLEGGEAVLADFGIARAISAAGGGSLTQTGMAIGTPVYMSPEQAAGDRELDGRTDLYAVGCVLYEMLAGHPPFMGTTSQEILRRQIMDPLPPLRSARAGVPEPVERAIAKALAKSPADRWASADQFAKALTSSRATAAVPLLRSPRARAIGLALAALAAAAGFMVSRRAAPPPAGVARLAVLPFENLGDSADAYFADGVADAVRGKLTALPNLEVIARASSMAYRRTDKTPQEVAGELGVRYLLTGTVRWAKKAGRASRVQVSPELVEIRESGAPASRWQQPFDAALTDVFQVQADIAGRVADALHLALGSADEEQLARRPTASLPAYDAFLKGEAAAQSLASWTPASLRAALGFYKEAVARDSGFGLAWARLAQAHSNLYAARGANTEDAEAAQAALKSAERLAPTAPETYRARSDYEELVRNDLSNALEASEAGLARVPGNVDLMASSAIIESRLGRIDAAEARLRRAETLDPHSFSVNHFLGIILCFQRRWDEARQAFDQAMALAPTELGAIEFRITTYLSEGDLAAARHAMAQISDAADRRQQAALMVDHDLAWLVDRPLHEPLLSLPPSAFDDDRAAWSLTRAELHHLRGEAALARVYADSARLEYENQLRAVPDDPWLHVAHGLALAFLGREAEAAAQGDRAGALLPIARDALFGPQIQHKRVRIHLLNGEHEKALTLLEPLLTVPYWLTPAWLRVDPTFAPLRGNARFERLVR
jgi:serine/threonine-protein kinase